MNAPQSPVAGGREQRLAPLRRPSGGFAMVALDQREALRLMLASGGRSAPIADATITRFKVAAAQALTPSASAVLLDRQFALHPVLAAGALAPGCGLILAADEFHAAGSVPVDHSTIDRAVDPTVVRAEGVAALKLLVVWRSDESPAERQQLVREFVTRCGQAGLASIIEPVTRPPRSGDSFDREAAIVAAARELGDLGADLYKAEVPYGGDAGAADLRDACRRLDAELPIPWVVLSTGVAPELFPGAVQAACAAGASGFLAGRAIWAPVLDQRDWQRALAKLSVPRLQQLAQIVDAALAERPAGSGR
jgi:sulfofructosephosphate aldolase